MKKVLFVEMFHYHDEVLLPQMEMLSSNFKTYAFVNKNLLKKGLINRSASTEIFSFDLEMGKRKNDFYQSLIHLCQTERFDFIVFNTMRDDFSSLLQYLPKESTIISIVHNLDKEPVSERVDKYLVLSKYIKENAQKTKESPTKFDYFYPLLLEKTKEIEHIEDKIIIAIPGTLTLKRRDYKGLIDFVKRYKPKNIIFELLGDTKKNEESNNIYKSIQQENLEEYFKTYDHFIPYDYFFSRIKHSDIIMPLIHPNVDFFENYHFNKISASFNMAYSFKKPLLLLDSFEKAEEFQDISFFYSMDILHSLLSKIDKNMILEKVSHYSNIENGNYTIQTEKYVSFFQETEDQT